MRKIILVMIMALLTCSQAYGAVYYAVHAGRSEDVRVLSVDVAVTSADVLSWDVAANWAKAKAAGTITSLDALVNSAAGGSLVIVSSGDYKLSKTLRPNVGTILYGGGNS